VKERELRKIVDIDTFAVFVHDTMQTIKANPPRIEPFENILSNNNVDKVAQAIQEARKKIHQPREEVVIRAIPWENIPERLQEVVSLQYPSAMLNETKVIDINLRSHAIVFSLRSKNSHDDVDRYGDIYIPYGLILQFADIEKMFFDPNGRTGKKGDFIICKVPLADQIREDVLMRKFFNGVKQTEEEDEWQTRQLRRKMSFEFFQVVPSSLIHLQEARDLIERFRDDTVVFTDHPQKTT